MSPKTPGVAGEVDRLAVEADHEAGRLAQVLAVVGARGVGGVREREADAVDLLCAALVEAGKLADVRSLLAEPPLHLDLGDDLRVREGLREARYLAGVIGMARV